MNFRKRILLACLAVALAPLVMLALGARSEVRRLLSTGFERNVANSQRLIQDNLGTRAAELDTLLGALARRLDADPAERAQLLHGDSADVVRYAAGVMQTVGLDYLLLFDSAGTILSSGHFQNEFGRTLPAFRSLLAADGPVLVSTRRPDRSFLALVRAHPFTIGDHRFVLAGGIEVNSTFVRKLAGDPNSLVLVSLSYPGGELFSDGRADPTIDTRAFTDPVGEALPFIDEVGDATSSGEANWMIRHSWQPLRLVRRRIDTWFLAASAAAILIAVVIARSLAARVTRPLEELAEKTERVNLDRLNVEFAMERDDEIGTLSRLLDSMVKRLRSSASQLRDAERRATVGDMARQVNHDVRNGLLPIRNVIRHLTEVARESPAELPAVLAERENTLQSGITYLETLAANYARLSPKSDAQSCDLNAIARTVVRDSAIGERARVSLELNDAMPRVLADPVALRRVIENLTINAAESLANGNGHITLTTQVGGTAGDRKVTLTVADTGSGIAPEAMHRIFDDFYTTKERGSGLGLSIVRRLVADMGGRIGVESQPGRGTTFRIELPASS